MEHIPCNICEQENAHPVYVLQDTNYGFAGMFSLVQCKRCALVYQNPRPTPAEMGAYYPVDRYHPFRALHESGPAIPPPLLQQRAHRLTTKIGPGQVLDVGCGSGLFLVAMQQRNWQGVGVEPNEAAARYAREILHLNVHQGDIFRIESLAGFDLITFWDVLEHTHAPKTILQHAYQLLRPGGYLALNVPNWDSVERHLFRQRWIALDAPRHLYHFAPASLRLLLETCGFKLELVKASAPPLSLASNVLRWLGDTFFRHGQAKALLPGNPAAKSRLGGHQLAIKVVHQMMRLPNALVNWLDKGASIFVIARKPVA